MRDETTGHAWFPQVVSPGDASSLHRLCQSVSTCPSPRTRVAQKTTVAIRGLQIFGTTDAVETETLWRFELPVRRMRQPGLPSTIRAPTDKTRLPQDENTRETDEAG